MKQNLEFTPLNPPKIIPDPLEVSNQRTSKLERFNSAMEGPSEVLPKEGEDDKDSPLSKSKILTREEVLKRRMRRLKRLTKCYRDHYWVLMEGLRQKHRQYYWRYGKGPFVEEEDDVVEERENGNLHSSGNNVDTDDKLGLVRNNSCCVYPTCKEKALALTKYCMMHIVYDTKQVLYKGCKFPIQRFTTTIADKQGSREGGEMKPLICGKAILKSSHPSICPSHSRQAKKEISQALKKGGVTVNLSSKVASKFNFHLVINEYIRMIQSSRRAIASRNVDTNEANNDRT